MDSSRQRMAVSPRVATLNLYRNATESCHQNQGPQQTEFTLDKRIIGGFSGRIPR
jgi:hypothetical protein